MNCLTHAFSSKNELRYTLFFVLVLVCWNLPQQPHLTSLASIIKLQMQYLCRPLAHSIKGVHVSSPKAIKINFITVKQLASPVTFLTHLHLSQISNIRHSALTSALMESSLSQGLLLLPMATDGVCILNLEDCVLQCRLGTALAVYTSAWVWKQYILNGMVLSPN